MSQIWISPATRRTGQTPPGRPARPPRQPGLAELPKGKLQLCLHIFREWERGSSCGFGRAAVARGQGRVVIGPRLFWTGAGEALTRVREALTVRGDRRNLGSCPVLPAAHVWAAIEPVRRCISSGHELPDVGERHRRPRASDGHLRRHRPPARPACTALCSCCVGRPTARSPERCWTEAVWPSRCGQANPENVAARGRRSALGWASPSTGSATTSSWASRRRRRRPCSRWTPRSRTRRCSPATNWHGHNVSLDRASHAATARDVDGNMFESCPRPTPPRRR